MTTWTPSPRRCGECGSEFLPLVPAHRFCSPACRERDKYRQLKADPQRWAAYLARRRAKYSATGRPLGRPPQVTVCTVDGCDEKHQARGFCLKHYRRDRYRRGLDRKAPVRILAALVKHYDESGEFVEQARPTRIVAKVSGFLLWPECPDCGQNMATVPTSNGMDLRDCAACKARVRLNVEEVSWVTSERRSTEASKRTDNSVKASTTR